MSHANGPHQRAIVTGASSGFGQAIAESFGRAGIAVALIGRNAERLQATQATIADAGGQAILCAADIADEAQINRAVEKAQQSLGEIDILVNNAGMNVAQRSIRDTSADQWRQLINVNLTAAYLFTKLLLPEMIERKTGTIINVASRAALHPHLAGGVAYSTSKMGMDALTQVTNEEGNPHHVRACLLCPGVGNTPLLDRRPSPPPAEERREMLQPEDVAAAALLVATLPQHVNIDILSLKPTWVGR